MILAGDFAPLQTNPSVEDFGNQWVVANLEGPVCDGKLTALPKIGATLCHLPFVLSGKWAFVLANNHIMDYGNEGLIQTFAFLESKNKGFRIGGYAGAGRDESSARRHMVLEEDGKHIAIISCCERQFGCATQRTSGVAMVGPWVLAAIRNAKKSGADYVVVSCHLASELSPFVSPELQDYYHSLIEAGADVIHGHHSHVPQGWESYHGKLILYGLGNFVIDPAHGWNRNPNYLWSLVARLDFSGEELRWSVKPFGQVPAYANRYLAIVNTAFSDKTLMTGLWQEMSMRLYDKLYGSNIHLPRQQDWLPPWRRFKRAVRVALDVLRSRNLVSSDHISRLAMVLYHYYGCESHRDAICTALGLKSGAIVDFRSNETEQIVAEIGGLQLGAW